MHEFQFGLTAVLRRQIPTLISTCIRTVTKTGDSSYAICRSTQGEGPWAGLVAGLGGGHLHCAAKSLP